MSDIRVKKSEVVSMSAVAEASALLRQIAEPRPVGDSVKAAITRAARRVSAHVPKHWNRWHVGRAEDIWHQQARGVWAEELDAIRAAADARAAQEARNEFREITNRIARLEAAMGVSDPEFGGPHLDALRSSVGGLDRPVDRGESD